MKASGTKLPGKLFSKAVQVYLIYFFFLKILIKNYGLIDAT